MSDDYSSSHDGGSCGGSHNVSFSDGSHHCGSQENTINVPHWEDPVLETSIDLIQPRFMIGDVIWVTGPDGHPSHPVGGNIPRPSWWNWWLRTLFGCACIIGVVALIRWWFP